MIAETQLRGFRPGSNEFVGGQSVHYGYLTPWQFQDTHTYWADGASGRGFSRAGAVKIPCKCTVTKNLSLGNILFVTVNNFLQFQKKFRLSVQHVPHVKISTFNTL